METISHTKNKNYTLNNYRIKFFRSNILLTTDHGSWLALSKEKYNSFRKSTMDKELFNLLEEKGIILTKHNAGKVVKDYRQRNKFIFLGTNLHIIVPTLRCNQSCIYCHSSSKHVDMKEYDMDEETMKKTIEFIFQTPSNIITIEFQGGDTLLRKDLFKATIKYSEKLNKKHNKMLKFALVTNLTLMDDNFLNYLIKHNISICTSLDGPSFIHDKNRPFLGGGGSYTEVVKWIRKVRGKKYPISALMVTTKYSLPYYKEIIDEYIKQGILSIQIKYINRLGFAEKEWNRIGYKIEEFIDFWKKSLNYILELNKKGIKVKSRYATIILHKLLTDTDPNFLDLRSPCGIVSGQLAYNYNGDIYSCDEGRNYEMFRLGNTKENSYKEILSSEQAQQLISCSINNNYLCDACIYQPFCGVCPVITYAEEGNIIPKLGKNSKCKIHKAMFDYIFEKLLFDEEVRKIFVSWIEHK
ncbi:MAG: His-Xaa-Ser system radical SAM maturase HxsB [Nanoarchaeota archaeon]|nr:His-Xaa-Ser system radical SAM maturase HxsB [Nanoarchaeota archaeon]